MNSVRRVGNLGSRSLVLAAALVSACTSQEPGTSTSSDHLTGPTTCVTIQRGTSGAVADAFIKSNALKQNFGGRPHLRVSAKEESLLQFDLSSIPASAAIKTATLKLYVNGENGDGTVLVHRVTAPWTEATVTYKSFAQKFASDLAGAFSTPSKTALQSADLTPLVKAWASGAKSNYGLVLVAGPDHHPKCAHDEDDDNDPTLFVSSDAPNVSRRPALVVCYAQPIVDLCSANPCENGAICTNEPTLPHGYTCQCKAGFNGTTCETNINECASNSCQNGGVCADGIASYTCACPAGFGGTSCETNIDDCAAAPCYNGGVCTDGIDQYTCACAPGYDGASCEHLIDNCNATPCHNGGSCTNAVNSYTCACAAGYTDANCDTNIDDCATNACHNGGTCVDGINDYTCSCDPDWGGALCEINLNSCAQAPCLNGGSCTNGFGTYTCGCPAGYSGANCEIDLDDCATNPCANGGTCVDGIHSFSCVCAAGYSGTTCGADIDDCATHPCANGGTCNDGINSFTCDCVPGYFGPTCGDNIDDCANSPCANGGTCIDGINNFTCQCPAGYDGMTCGNLIDNCVSGPCHNGATCTNHVNAFTCACAPGYGDATCDTNINDCAGDPCANGGVCTDEINGFSCQCAAGFSGTTCNTNIDDCAGNPCANGGTCLDGVNSFTCACQPGYFGATCGSFSCAVAPDGTTCDDHDACTQADACAGGACGGGAVACPIADQCHVGLCDVMTGCGLTEKPDGATCNDGVADNYDDVCIGGYCGGTSLIFIDTPSTSCNPWSFTATVYNSAMTLAGRPWSGSIKFEVANLHPVPPVTTAGTATVNNLPNYGDGWNVNAYFFSTTPGIAGFPVLPQAHIVHRDFACP